MVWSSQTTPGHPAHPARTGAYTPPWRKLLPRGMSLGGLTLKQLASSVWHSADDDDITGRAAELAYYFLFAAFPALIFLSSMFGMMAGGASQMNYELMHSLAKVIPPSAFGMVQSTFVSTTKASSAGKLTFGAVTALWTATYGMAATQTVLNAVYRIKETRPFWKTRSIAIGLTLAMLVLVFSAMLLLLSGGWIAKFLMNDLLVNAPIFLLWKFLQVGISLFFLALVFSLTYYWGPDLAEPQWHWMTPGAMVGICGWLLISIGFRIYLHHFNSYAITYGSVGAVIILLTWLYVSGLMVLLGAEINATIERASGQVKTNEADPG